MKLLKAAVLVLVALQPYISLLQAANCPMAGTQEAAPDDILHSALQKDRVHRRHATSLFDDPDSKAKLTAILENGKQRTLQEACFTAQTYDDIDADIANLADAIVNDEARSHFYGAIVRLAAHDFLDFNVDDSNDAFGPDGCIDFSDPIHAGIEDVWCDGCGLTVVYENNYSHISRADFWIACAQAVIRQTSGGGLDLKDSFRWGRVDRGFCPQSAPRLPKGMDCSEVEDVFINRLGLTYTDAVALIGAHTLGRGDAELSGHHGIWVDTVEESLVFDKRFYEEILRRAWVPRNLGSEVQDWTWGRQNGNNPRFMLNTDMCLFYDLDSTFPCCSRTDQDGNPCDDLSQTPCSTYDHMNPRKAAADAVELFATGGGNSIQNDNNLPFFLAFESAWVKATSNGWTNLSQLDANCDLSNTDPTLSPSSSPTTSPTINHPTSSPSVGPTSSITTSPTYHPTAPRSIIPSANPTGSPTIISPTNSPSNHLSSSPIHPGSNCPTRVEEPQLERWPRLVNRKLCENLHMSLI